jgi:hypothetical protein
MAETQSELINFEVCLYHANNVKCAEFVNQKTKIYSVEAADGETQRGQMNTGTLH